MNKLMLAIAGVAAVFATISPDAQSRGVVSGWSSSPTSSSTSGSVSGFTTMGATGTGGSHSSGLSSAIHGAGSVSGYSLPSSAGGVGTTSLMPYSAPLHLNPNGTLSHGVASGSLSTNDNTGMLSMITSPSELASGTPGVGNSEASVYYAQLASFSQGSSFSQGTSSGLGSSAITSGLASGGLLARIANYLANASGSNTTNNGIPNSSASTQPTIATGPARMGLTANKSCAGGVGASAHSCN